MRTFSQRQLKVGENIRQVLASILSENLFHDPELSKTSITVSEVRVSPDLKKAKVFVIPLGGTKEPKIFLEALKQYAPQLRSLLAKKISLRFLPELSFTLDESFDNASHIDQLLKQGKLDDPLS